MSKQELQARALKHSGVSYEESLRATSCTPSMFDRLGGVEGCLELSTLFYNHVFDSGEDWFLHIFSSSTRREAIENQYRFFAQTFGGPDLYRQKKGKYTRLVGRHANYHIGNKAAKRWVEHMEEALKEHSRIKNDDESREMLHLYFRYTAHYIVAGMDYMRSDQLSGGTEIDSDRIW